MSYIMLEYLVCVVAVLGFTTLLFLISLIVVLADEGFAYVSRVKRRDPSPTSHVSSSFGGLIDLFKVSARLADGLLRLVLAKVSA